MSLGTRQISSLRPMGACFAESIQLGGEAASHWASQLSILRTARTLGVRSMPLPTKEKPDLSKKVHDVPHKPGVYLMRDRFNRVIYVGKARDLRKRVASYFMPSKLAVADIKTRAMLESVWDFETHTVRSEAESVLLEGKLIKEYRPRYNISFRDDKRFLVVKVDQSEEWPRFRLARFKKDDGARYFGPYAHSGALRQTLNFMRKKFGVLTFGRGSPTERELKSRRRFIANASRRPVNF